MKPATSSNSDLVLQVHGTFASRTEDAGENWWQIGSDSYEGIRQRLPEGVAMTGPSEVFHWSGENSERARIKAAFDLLSRLKELEKSGRHYHLIGHSHGGSVIWHTLRMATLNRLELPHLRSWTTVGTPYLRHTLRRTTWFSNLLRLGLGLALIKPATVTAMRFFDLVFRPSHALWLGHGGAIPERFSFYETPVLRLLEVMRIPVERTATGVKIGSYDHSAGHSHLEFLLFDPIGWLIITLAVVVILVYLNLAAFFLRPVIESWQVWAESRLERHAKHQFASRWLGIWSPDDEAINGLRATLNLSVEFVSKMTPQDRVLFSDYATIAMQPYYWVMTPVFNRFLRPFLDRMVRSMVIKSAQGNNRPGTEVVEVSVAPWHVEPSSQPLPLPGWFNQRLVQRANDIAKEVIPKLRSLLAAPSFTTGLQSFGKSSNGGEMVHTSYFDHAEVLDLLAMHIAGACERSPWHVHSASGQREELAQWLCDAKLRVGNQWFAWQYEKSSHSVAAGEEQNIPRQPIRPRRRENRTRAA
ncbi:MAG: hypothetical protein ACK5OB_08945 [Pirellula sp.]